MLINLVLNTSISMLWSMMNTLQIIVFMPLINLAFPGHVTFVSLILFDIANFDILPSSLMNEIVLRVNEDNIERAELKFRNYGYETYSFLSNSGSVLWLMILWAFTSVVILALCILVTKLFKRSIKFLNSIKEILFFFNTLCV